MSKFFKKCRIVIGFVMIFISFQINAQTAAYAPSVIPPSPNASSLMKFADVPISSYTGAADVSIPIYTIQARGLNVPITISNHTGGIRLKEESGWVGLGWALDNGGMISRQIKDKDDFEGHYFTTGIPQIINKAIYAQSPTRGYHGTYAYGINGYDFFCNYLVNTNTGTVDFTSAFSGANTALYDLEADVFNYSFPGKSGKFIITRDQKVLIQNQENIKILYETNGNSFTIMDDQGNKFFFMDREYTGNPSGVGSSISSWYLSKIITQVNDTIKYTYTSDATYTNVASDLNMTNRVTSTCNAGISGVQGPATQYLNITLQNIDFSNGQLQFSFDNQRDDLQGGKKLNNIKLFSKDAAGALNYIKENQLYYSYFYTGQGYEFARLRLDSLKEVSGSASLAPYAFTYNFTNPGFAGKHSYAVDHWGYYNGVSGNSSFIPSFNDVADYAGVNSYMSVPGANREPDAASMNLFSLSQVQYPTGGKTVFEYEPNDYDFFNSVNGPSDFINQPIIDTVINLGISARGTTTGSIDMSKLYGISTGVAQNATLTVTFRNATNGGNNAYRGTNGKIYFNAFGINTDISSGSVTCPSNLPICTTGSINMGISQAKAYIWTAYIDPSIAADFLDITVMITWHELKRVHNNNPTLMAGGLRIKSVTELNQDNSPIKKRRYDYGIREDRLGKGSAQSYTYGRLMSIPSYARYEIVYGGLCKPSLTLFGSSNTGVTSVIKGNIVGYDQVAEYNVDPVTGVDIGKTVYYYFGGSDTLNFFNGYRLPGVSNTGNSLYGSLLKKEIYKNSNGLYQKVAETGNYYHTANRNIVYDFKGSFLGATSNFSQDCGTIGFGASCVPNEMYGNFSTAMKSEKVLLDSSKEIMYDQTGNGNTIINTKNYFYDNALHYQPTRTRFADSKGNTIVSLMKYPQDYIPNGNTATLNTILDSMINRNMISELIEKRDSLYYSGSPTGYVTGAQLSQYKLITANSLGLDKQFNLDVQAPVTDFQGFAISGNTITMDSRYRQMVSMDSYDNLNNIQQYTGIDQLPVSFIWDYKQVYPIAQAKNATANETAYTSFEADGNGNWSFTDTARNRLYKVTGGQCYNLTGAVTISRTVTSGKPYYVTYWSRNGAINVNGVSATSGLTKNGWTYYQHLLPNTTTTVNITGTATIDELRLFPSTAQMMTYTYIPLKGISSTCSVNNLIQYNVYDPLGRLKQIIDQDANIIKTIEYHYQNQVGF